MNKFEKAIADQYKREGWRVFRSGWPDFLLYREHEGSPLVVGAEVKPWMGHLEEHQEEIIKILSKKIPVLLVREGSGYGESHKAGRFDFHTQIYGNYSDLEDMERCHKISAILRDIRAGK